MNMGKIVQVIGPVVDVEFEPGKLPEIYNSILVRTEDQPEEMRNIDVHLVLETLQHLGNNRVRCVAMDATDGLQRGMVAADTGEAISVPVGEETLGRMFNVIGEAIDGKETPIQGKGIQSTDLPLLLKSRTPQLRCWKQESRLLTFSAPMQRAARLVCLGAQV